MKRLLGLILVSGVALLCMGMGDIGGQPQGSVPHTDVQVHAKVIDKSGVATELSQFSMAGETFLAARRGSGDLTIPFLQMGSLDFGASNGDNTQVKATLKGGETLDLVIQKRAVFYGSTGYGAFSIKARDLVRIEFP